MVMNQIMRFRAAPVSTTEVKLNLFAPVDKISDKQRYKYETVVHDDIRFKVTVTGVRLTQIHRDILDIALFHGSHQIENEVEQAIPVRTFSLYSVQKHLRHKNRHNQQWLERKFQELKLATIRIYDKQEREEIEFNIIRVAKRSDKIKEFVLVFEELYFAFFESQISISYKKLLPDILALKHPQTKAVVRYLLSFKAGRQENLDSLLRRVGLQGEERNLRYYRRLVAEELKKVGERFNIEIIGEGRDTTASYTRHDEVAIYYPKQHPTLF